MAQLPGRLAADLSRLAAALALAAAPAAAGQVDLEGTWHVLVHYRDANTAHPETDRWDDRLWEFEPKGDRLRWTEFPIVIFEDETGRFEQLSTSRAARVLHAWEPSPEQLANIRAGLAANDRGSQSKTLRRTGEGWASTLRPSGAGASVITYQESWSVEDPEGLPVFTQDDVLGAETAASFEGRTQLRTEQVLEGGELLVGSFARDEARRGTFQMRRAGPRREVAKTSSNEQVRRAALSNLLRSPEAKEVLEPLRAEFAKQGIELDQAEMDRLAKQAVELLSKGSTLEEVQQRLAESVAKSRGLPPPEHLPAPAEP
jgi:hypothetical protein